MKKMLLSFIPILLLTACSKSASSSSNFDKFFNKKYIEQGASAETEYYYEFHETFCGLGANSYKYACFYESRKLLYDYNRDEFTFLELDKNKNYVYVFAQGRDSEHPTFYQSLGFFYDDNTFVLVDGKYNNSYVVNVYICK